MATFAVIEVPARFGEGAITLGCVDALLGRVHADLVLLPEASLTGYVSPQGDFDLRPFGEPIDGPLRRAMSARSRRWGTYLGWPLIESEGERFFNSYCITGPDGDLLLHYRKRHPWYPETWATAGDRPYPLCRIADVQVTLAICFDIHFLGEAAGVLDQADVLLFPSAWVEADQEGDSRQELFAGLSRRHGVGIVNANWGAGDVVMAGQSGSRIIGRDGGEIARVGREGFAAGVVSAR